MKGMLSGLGVKAYGIGFLALVVLTSAFAVFLSCVNVYARDTQHLLSVALQLYFFLTPIFYDVKSIPDRFRPFFDANPMLHLVEAYRAILMHGQWPAGLPLVYVGLFSVGMIVLGWRVYNWARYRYLEEM